MTEQFTPIMVRYFGKDLKRINHALKVLGFASAIATTEKLNSEQIEVIKLAAIFHDIGIPEAEKKYNSSAGKLQEKEGPAVARELLSNSTVQKELLERVYFLIGNHHSYQKIDGIDFQVLVEADFLVNIDEDKMLVETIEKIKSTIFKTESGTKILKNLYL